MTVRVITALEDYRQALLAAGVSEAEADRVVAASRAEDAALDAHACPACAGPISRKQSLCQCGASGVAGVWFSYRCPCGFMIDRKEPIGVN